MKAEDVQVSLPLDQTQIAGEEETTEARLQRLGFKACRPAADGGEECPACGYLIKTRMYPRSCSEWRGRMPPGHRLPQLCSECPIFYVCAQCSLKPVPCMWPTTQLACSECDVRRRPTDHGPLEILLNPLRVSWCCDSCWGPAPRPPGLIQPHDRHPVAVYQVTIQSDRN
jgi:hypothetical protein